MTEREAGNVEKVIPDPIGDLSIKTTNTITL